MWPPEDSIETDWTYGGRPLLWSTSRGWIVAWNSTRFIPITEELVLDRLFENVGKVHPSAK